MVFQCINIRQVPWEVLKTTFGLGFQHLPRDLANVNVWKTMFDPYIANAMANGAEPDQTTSDFVASELDLHCLFPRC